MTSVYPTLKGRFFRPDKPQSIMLESPVDFSKRKTYIAAQPEKTRFLEKREIFTIRSPEGVDWFLTKTRPSPRNRKSFYYFCRGQRPEAVTKLEFAKLNKVVVITKARNGVSIPILKDENKDLEDTKLEIEQELALRQEKLEAV